MVLVLIVIYIKYLILKEKENEVKQGKKGKKILDPYNFLSKII